MTRYKVTAVFNGTELNLSIPGNSIDRVMERIRHTRSIKNMVRTATMFLFYSRANGSLVDCRFN